MKKTWKYRNSGLALICLPIYPAAYQVFTDLGGLVEVLKISQGDMPPVQSDISTNPYILTPPDELHKARTLRILTSNYHTFTRMFNFVAELRLHTKDLGGDSTSVCMPDTFYNQSHAVLFSQGFSLNQYHPWAVKHCSTYYPPNKKVVDSMEV